MEYIRNPNGNCRLCKETDDAGKLVTCLNCDRWFHIDCVGLKTVQQNFCCPKCTEEIKEKKRVQKDNKRNTTTIRTIQKRQRRSD